MVSQGAIGVAIKYFFHIIYDREVRKKLKVFQKSKMIALCMISRDHLKALFKREDFKMGSFLKFDQVVPEIHEFQYSKKGFFFQTRLLRGNLSGVLWRSRVAPYKKYFWWFFLQQLILPKRKGNLVDAKHYGIIWGVSLWNVYQCNSELGQLDLVRQERSCLKEKTYSYQ